MDQDELQKAESAYLDSFQLPYKAKENSLQKVAIKRSDEDLKWRFSKWKT